MSAKLFCPSFISLNKKNYTKFVLKMNFHTMSVRLKKSTFIVYIVIFHMRNFIEVLLKKTSSNFMV